MNDYEREFDEAPYRRHLDPMRSDYAARDRLVKKYAWAVPNQKALEAIAAHGPIVEVGAGRGYWASLLHDMGVDIVAYDLAPPDIAVNHYCVPRDGTGEFGDYTVCHHPVTFADELIGAKHPDRALLLIWPCYDRRWAHDAVRAYHEAGGKTVIFVGEGSGGCTADRAFFDYLYHFGVKGEEEEEDRYGCTEYISLPQWSGIHDGLEIHRLRPVDDSYIVRRRCSGCYEMQTEATFVVVEEGRKTTVYEGHSGRGKRAYRSDFSHEICLTCYQEEWLPQHLLPANCEGT